jgi:hypothetical protein
MLLVSLNGRRRLCVARATRDRIIDHISRNPGKTTIEYASETLIAEPTINLVIELHLLPLAAAGAIAVSRYGRKPDWYYLVDPRVVPLRKAKRKLARIVLRDITDRQLRLDYVGLVNHFDDYGSRLSPARRDAARREFVDRINHVGGSHQTNIDDTSDLVTRLENKMQGMEEAIQVMATALTSTSVRALA